MENNALSEDIKHYDVALIGSGFVANYGAVLTNYAMYKIIESLNLKPLMVDKPKMLNSIAFNSLDYENTIARRFMKKYMNVSEVYTNNNDLSKLNDICDIFIVDSDQNWRVNNFGESPYYFFLDWVQDSRKKLSYAASFGTDKLEYCDTLKNNISYLLSRFDSISVREDSGVKICKEKFGVNAAHVLDPVFIADKKIYNDLSNAYCNKLPNDEYILTYILDKNIEKTQILDYVKEKINIKTREIEDVMKDRTNVKDYPSIEEFVYIIKNSKYIVTDSFHGICFSIIFNKPFICIPNKPRGYTRFESLLKLLKLSDRMVDTLDELKSKSYLLEPIDYNEVNKILAQESERSLNWLKNALNSQKKDMHSSFDYMKAQIHDTEALLKDEIKLLRKENSLQKYKIKLLANKNKIKFGYSAFKVLDIITLSRYKKINNKFNEYEGLYTDLQMLKKF